MAGDLNPIGRGKKALLLTKISPSASCPLPPASPEGLLNRRDFFRLHRLNAQHFGIIACVDDKDRQRMAKNINQAIIQSETLINQLIRVYRVPPPNL